MKESKIKTLLLLFIVFLSFTNIYANGNKIFYVSPGADVSWDLDGEFIFSPKISIGFYENKTFYNLTLGYVSSENVKLYPYYYIEPQFGKLSDPMEFRKLQIFTGLGLGVAIHNKATGSNISLRASLFSGFGLFVKSSFLYSETLYTDIGLEAILPIPLSKFEFGSPGGIK